jgi:ketosteroid isomerase-like protein
MADDVAILRAGYEAFGRGDVPAVLEVFDPDIEWTEPEGYPWGRVYRGHGEVLGMFQDAAGQLGPEWKVEPDRFVATEDGVLVTGRHTGRNAAGPWEVPFAMVWEMRDGKATRFRQYGDTVLMRAAAGAT